MDGPIVLVLQERDDQYAVREALMEQKAQLQRHLDSYPCHTALITHRLDSLGRCLLVIDTALGLVVDPKGGP